MSNSDELNALLKAHKKAVQIAHETAARTGTLLVSRQGDKVVMVKPNIKYLGFAPIKSANPSSASRSMRNDPKFTL
jgi:hypothetical protein